MEGGGVGRGKLYCACEDEKSGSWFIKNGDGVPKSLREVTTPPPSGGRGREKEKKFPSCC
jgi:hypothetical protein